MMVLTSRAWHGHEVSQAGLQLYSKKGNAVPYFLFFVEHERSEDVVVSCKITLAIQKYHGPYPEPRRPGGCGRRLKLPPASIAGSAFAEYDDILRRFCR